MRFTVYLTGFLLTASSLYGSPVERQYTNSSTSTLVIDTAVHRTVPLIQVSSVATASISPDTQTTTVDGTLQVTTALNSTSLESPKYSTDRGQVLVYVTETQTITYPYLHTTLTDTVSYLDDARTHRANNGAECAYDGINCPVYTVSQDSIQSRLKAANNAACLKANSYTHTTGFAAAPKVCCGGCQLHFLKVDVFYFPPDNASCIPDPYAPSTTPAASLHARDEAHLHARFNSLGAGSTVVLNGYTFVSPSIYVGFSTVYANNDCGLVGSIHTNFTLGFAPGELSTLWAPFPAWPVMTTRPFDANSVTCGDRPVISAPAQLLTYDPDWKTCGQDLWQGVDPPYVLNPAPYLNKDPPVATVDAPAQTTPASPGPSPEPAPAPAQTRTTMFQPKPVLSMADPGQPARPTDIGTVTAQQPSRIPDPPVQSVDPGQNPKPTFSKPAEPVPDPTIQPVDPGQTPKPALSKPAEPAPDQSTAPGPVIVATYITTADGTKVQTVPIFSLQNLPPALDPSRNPTTADLGAIILSAFLNNDPSGKPQQPNPSGAPPAAQPAAGADPASFPTTIPQPAAPVFTAAGQTITAPNPSSIILQDGKTLILSGPTLTINNTPFYLGSAGFVVGSSTIPIPIPATVPPSITSAAAPSLLALASGTTLTLGGPTLTIHGTTVYYGSAGLVVGSSTIPVPGGPVSATLTAGAIPTAGSGRLPTMSMAGGAGTSSVVINPFRGTAAQRGRIRWEMMLVVLAVTGTTVWVL